MEERTKNKLLWAAGIIGGIILLSIFADYQTAFMLGFISVPVIIFFLIFKYTHKLCEKLFKKFFPIKEDIKESEQL